MISRGQIYFANLSSTRGREQRGYRPVLVVSADAINRHPTNVRVTAGESGLSKDTVFLCFQIRFPAGNLQGPRMAEVDEALKRVLNLR